MKNSYISAAAGFAMALLNTADADAGAKIVTPCESYTGLAKSFLALKDAPAGQVDYFWQSYSHDAKKGTGTMEGLIVTTPTEGRIIFPEEFELAKEQIGAKAFDAIVATRLGGVKAEIDKSLVNPGKANGFKSQAWECSLRK